VSPAGLGGFQLQDGKTRMECRARPNHWAEEPVKKLLTTNSFSLVESGKADCISMDPHTYANTSGLYGAMAYPLVDDWELVESALLKSPPGSYVLYRSTEARQQQQDVNYKDTIYCFEV
jgi:hypothetical protein